MNDRTLDALVEEQHDALRKRHRAFQTVDPLAQYAFEVVFERAQAQAAFIAERVVQSGPRTDIRRAN